MVGDAVREGDFWELLPKAADNSRQTFLVRVSRSTRRSVRFDTGDRPGPCIAPIPALAQTAGKRMTSDAAGLDGSLDQTTPSVGIIRISAFMPNHANGLK